MQDKNVAEKLENLRRTITKVYGEELWTAVKTGMAVVASLSLKGIANPISLLYEGGAGRGKSTIINLLDPDRDATKARIYRLDKFTPKAFVTHAANVSQKDMEEIDLLPKLKDKTMLSKELAPMFRGRDDELRENFATLTAVLDGKGLRTASGVHGTRGYEGRCVFNWLGATTPIPERTDAIMAQLGNRLLRYEILGKEPTEEELLQFAATHDPIDKEELCREAVNDFLTVHFAQCPLRSVDPQEIIIPKAPLTHLVRLCQLIAHGRVEVKRAAENAWSTGEDEFTPGIPEGPQRIILYVRAIAQGLALLAGRKVVNAEDLVILRHIAFSSIPNSRRDVLRTLLLAGGKLDAASAQARLRVSRPTATRRMKELAATGIVTWAPGNGNSGQSLSLAEGWDWLLDESLDDSDTDIAEAVPETFPENKVPLWVQVNPFNLSQS